MNENEQISFDLLKEILKGRTKDNKERVFTKPKKGLAQKLFKDRDNILNSKSINIFKYYNKEECKTFLKQEKAKMDDDGNITDYDILLKILKILKISKLPVLETTDKLKNELEKIKIKLSEYYQLESTKKIKIKTRLIKLIEPNMDIKKIKIIPLKLDDETILVLKAKNDNV